MMSGAFRAVVTATAAAGMAITALGERWLLIGTVTALCVLFAFGWPRLLGLPSRRGAEIVLMLTVAASVTVVELTRDVAWVTTVFAGSVIASMVHELARRAGRPRLVESVSGVVTGCAIIVSATGWLAIGTSGVPLGMVICGSVTLAAAAAVTAPPIPSPYSPVLTIVVALLVGLGVGVAVDTVGTTTGTLVGLAAGLLIASLHHLFGRFPSSGQMRSALAAAVLPVAVSGLPIYVLGRVVVGP